MKKAEINKLDKLFREVINERDNGVCQFCGNSGNNVHHIVGRRNRSTRWLPDNGLLLCPADHTFRSTSFHQDPLSTMKWFEETYPERYAHINELKNQILKHDFQYYKDLLDTGIN